MNTKAEKFVKLNQDNNLNWFQGREFEDELHTAVFEGALEIGESRLPVFVVLDDSLFSLIRVVISAGPVAKANRDAVEAELGRLNAAFKSFKYYVSDEADNEGVILDLSVPTTGEDFNAEVIMYLITQIALPHLEETLANTLGIINKKEKATKAPRKTTKSKK